jgi:regulator of protease activity HflC (stomatin/prohibitin superfamily)
MQPRRGCASEIPGDGFSIAKLAARQQSVDERGVGDVTPLPASRMVGTPDRRAAMSSIVGLGSVAATGCGAIKPSDLNARFGHFAAEATDEDAMGWITFLVIPVAIYVIVSLRVLKQYERGVVFLLGKFAGVRGPGLTLVFVPVQQMVRVSLRTVTMQIPSQKIITKDNVSIDIAAVAYYHITEPEKAVIAIENVYNAINQISQTTVRNVVGRFSLDQLLSDTASINDQIKNVIDQHTEPWGTQVTAVEIKDITLPDNMQRAMAKEAEAERERRAKIVAAEGEYQAAVKLGEAADIITQHPVALQLRTLQTMAEISVEKNSTIIFPAQFMTTVQEAIALLSKDSASK